MSINKHISMVNFKVINNITLSFMNYLFLVVGFIQPTLCYYYCKTGYFYWLVVFFTFLYLFVTICFLKLSFVILNEERIFKKFGFSVSYSEYSWDKSKAREKLMFMLKTETEMSKQFVDFIENSHYIRYVSNSWYSNWREYCKNWYSSSLAESIDKV